MPGYFWDRWLYFAGKLSLYIITTQVNLALYPSGVTKSSTSFGWGKGGKVTPAGWQLTLCDSIWHVISDISLMISITNCYIRYSIRYYYYYYYYYYYNRGYFRCCCQLLELPMHSKWLRRTCVSYATLEKVQRPKEMLTLDLILPPYSTVLSSSSGLYLVSKLLVVCGMSAGCTSSCLSLLETVMAMVTRCRVLWWW